MTKKYFNTLDREHHMQTHCIANKWEIILHWQGEKETEDTREKSVKTFRTVITK